MVEKINLFKVVLENLLNGDATESVYTLRSLADEIETSGCLDYEEIQYVLNLFVDEDSDYRQKSFEDEDNEEYLDFDNEY